jgi:hypothetical protein
VSLRELTVAFASRQLLDERRPLPVDRAVEHMVAVQAQYHPSVALALAARVAGFRPGDADTALAAPARLRKATLMRGTLHVVSAADYPYCEAALRPAGLEHWRRRYGGDHINDAALTAALRDFLREPRTVEEIRSFILSVTAGALPEHGLMHTAKALVPMVHHVEPGRVVTQGRPRLVAAPGSFPDHADAVCHLVHRYLRGFGPASREDIATFTSLRLRVIDAALARLGPLRRLVDDSDRELVDLPDAPLPAADLALPTRFLPKWDSALLGHRVRARILPDSARSRVIVRVNGDVRATFLIDGTVAGVWTTAFDGTNATLTMEPFGPVASYPPDLEAEARRVLACLYPSARSTSIADRRPGPG